MVRQNAHFTVNPRNHDDIGVFGEDQPFGGNDINTDSH
jgi:hypothetical protein